MSFSSISSSKILTSFTKYQTPTSNNVPTVTKPKMMYREINERNSLEEGRLLTFWEGNSIFYGEQNLLAAVKFSRYRRVSPL